MCVSFFYSIASRTSIPVGCWLLVVNPQIDPLKQCMVLMWPPRSGVAFPKAPRSVPQEEHPSPFEGTRAMKNVGEPNLAGWEHITYHKIIKIS